MKSLQKKDAVSRDTWKKEMDYTKGMQKRGKSTLKMVSKLHDWESVVDVGCGNQQLRKVVESLNPKAKYIGVDRLDHCPDTLIANFNKGEFPNIHADLAIVSGVFEYIQPEMVDTFLNNVCKTAPFVVMSYFPTDYDAVFINKTAKTPKKRSELWVNHFTLVEIIELFNKRGFQIEILKRYKASSQYIMIFSYKK